MSKTGDIAKVSAKGSFDLLWGLIVSTVISAVGTIFIARLLGSDEYGLYTVVLTVPAIIGIFRDWGVNSAMIKFTAQFRAEGRTDEIRSIFLTGLIFEVSVGLVLTIVSFFLADFLAVSVLNRPTIARALGIQHPKFLLSVYSLNALSNRRRLPDSLFSYKTKISPYSTLLQAFTVIKENNIR